MSEFLLVVAYPGEFLDFLLKVAAGECDEEVLVVGGDGDFEYLLDLDEGQAVPLIAGDVVQQ